MHLHWFRTDLRVHDNPALAAALATGPALACYVATPGQWRQHRDAPIKQDFWRRNLQCLEAELEGLGVPLLYLQVDDYQQLPELFGKLAAALGLTDLHFNREYGLNERRRDKAVAETCRALGVQVWGYHGQVLLPPGSVMTQAEAPFKVFTPFGRRARALLEAGLPSPPALGKGRGAAIPSPESLKGLPVASLEQLSWPRPRAHWAELWPAGETEAFSRLQHFCLERLQAYRDRRDFPALDATSRLSPWLASGVISVAACWRGLSQMPPGPGGQTWGNELLWREFYHHVMYHFPHVCRHQPWRADVGHVPWRRDWKDYRRWCLGRTGVPIVDAAMRQLLKEGWMHNRLRMISAMYFSKHLLLDWRWGERWFMQHLVDGDFAANNGGWQWSASTGTDAAPYFRIFNPHSQSRRFDPQGAFIRSHLPVLSALDDKAIHDPGLLRPRAYPGPMVDLQAGRARALDAFRAR